MIPGLCSAFYQGRASSGSFSASAAPPFVVGTGNSVVVSPSVTASPSGGTGPYTYLWYQDSGDPSIAIGFTTAASTVFSANVGVGDSIVGKFACQVTDSTATTVTTNLVNVRFGYAP